MQKNGVQIPIRHWMPQHLNFLVTKLQLQSPKHVCIFLPKFLCVPRVHSFAPKKTQTFFCQENDHLWYVISSVFYYFFVTEGLFKKKKKITCDRLLCLSSWSEQDSVFKLHLNIEELAMEDCSITGGSFWSLCETI